MTQETEILKLLRQIQAELGRMRGGLHEDRVRIGRQAQMIGQILADLAYLAATWRTCVVI